METRHVCLHTHRLVIKCSESEPTQKQQHIGNRHKGLFVKCTVVYYWRGNVDNKSERISVTVNIYKYYTRLSGSSQQHPSVDGGEVMECRVLPPGVGFPPTKSNVDWDRLVDVCGST